MVYITNQNQIVTPMEIGMTVVYKTVLNMVQAQTTLQLALFLLPYSVPCVYPQI